MPRNLTFEDIDEVDREMQKATEPTSGASEHSRTDVHSQFRNCSPKSRVESENVKFVKRFP